MPWRQDTRSYYVLVSELMLQQTQVSRVIPKFKAFIAAFPNEQMLARASLADVLIVWQGLGYNRRAKFLHDAARKIMTDFQGNFPDSQEKLMQLPGVGKNTAGAILAYSFNQPAIFIETNIRTVFIHHFFAKSIAVSDKEIEQKLIDTLDYEHPREWYWSLMDYGSWLKASGVRTNAQSKQYKKQSQLEGSVRQMRGKILQVLSVTPELEYKLLKQAVKADERFEIALTSLQADGLISRANTQIYLTK